VLVSTVVLGIAPAAEADLRTDVVTLNNGDRLTCTLKKLERGRLTIKTDALGTVTVFWDDVVSLESPKTYEVEDARGTRYYGALRPGKPREIVVLLPDGTATPLPLLDVVRLAPLGSTFIARIDGSISLGFSFTQANEQTQWTLNGDASYRARRYLTETTFSSQLTAIEDVDTQTRNVLSMSGRRFIGQHWFTAGFGQFQQDEALDLDFRAVLGGVVGRYLVQRPQTTLSVFGGMALTREYFANDGSGENSAEAVAGVDIDWFTPGESDTDFQTTVISFYNVSGRARARVELTSAFQRKLLKDLFWSINVFNSYDSSPPGDEKKNDFGVNLALGWSF
jgi:hypothetical protein